MKTMNKIQLVLLGLAVLVLGSCSDKWLDREPIASTMSDPQYQKLPDKLEGALLGVYSMLYTYSGHDAFSKRSIDMYGDLLSGDMALTSKTYGWFYTDERQETRAERSGYMWSLYYRMMANINATIYSIKEETPLLDAVAAYGLPNDGLMVIGVDGDTLYTFTESEAKMAGCYAQALTLRGYIYGELTRLYCPTMSHVYYTGNTPTGLYITTYAAFPLYNEDNYKEVQPMAMLSEVYDQVEGDLETAIAYFDAFKSGITRDNKLMVDINVARGVLAYSCINKALLHVDYDETMPLVKEPMTKALQYAEDVISSGEYRIIPNEKLTTTGFNNVEEESWMWGEDVTVETSTGLGSFFGQVDIHSYSYAWSGDTKVIDKELYDRIPSWDGRKKWFNDGSKNATFKLCPDGKFFSEKFKASNLSTRADDIDREWLSDNVFMRIESMYLIAAEAAYFLHDQGKAVMYLDAILSERLNLDDPNAVADFAAFNATLNDRTAFIQELYRNWRLEMWGEGYGLQTFRRLSYLYKDDTHAELNKVYRGANHLYNPSKPIDYSDETIYTMNIPASELNYNPYMQDDESPISLAAGMSTMRKK